MTSTALPTPLTRFVGREAELVEAAALLAGARLLTLTGPGGVGKTRLALRLASAVADEFPEGVWFVDLSALSVGDFVWAQVALALDVRGPGPGGTLADAVGGRLAPRHSLLVLDNCEHVVESAAEVASAVLGAAQYVKVVATSREPLGVGGEVTWAVPPLVEGDAVELFTDRARKARPHFELRDDDAPAVRSICRRLDGLPLAIELAAARTRALDPTQIAGGLKERFALLPAGPRTAPRRQSTLAASFDWSYQLLSDAERACLRQLSVFAGGFDVEAALAVCPAASLELLAALTDRSLIMVEGRSSQAQPRFRMLETVRQFATEHLDEANEAELLRTRHRDHYLALAEFAEPKLISPDEDRWRARLQSEQDNLRAAMAWSRDRDEADALARLVTALWWVWPRSPRLAEFQMWMAAAAERAEELSPALRARIRNCECELAPFTGSLGEVPALANEALALARASGDRREESLALFALATLSALLGGAETLRPYLEEGLPLARSSGAPWVVAQWLELAIAFHMFQSNPDETRRLAEEAVGVAKAMDRHHRLDSLLFSGQTALFQGRLHDAANTLETVVIEGRETSDLNSLYGPLFLALVKMFRGDFAAALAMVAESRAAAEAWKAEARYPIGVDFSSRFFLGWIQLASGEAAQASDNLVAVVEQVRQSPARRWTAVPLVTLAAAQLEVDALDEARTSLEEAASLARSEKLTWVLGRVARVRATLRARQGEQQEAESLAHEAIVLGREAGDQLGLVDALELLARLAGEQDSHSEALRLWAAAESRRASLGYARFPVDQPMHDVAIARARQELGGDGFAAAWAEGVKLSVDEAIAYAVRGRGRRRRPKTGWSSLTPSELEVARLVGEHLTNPEIAKRLFISRSTVKTHVAHIFEKLGIDSRSELATVALKHRTA